MRLVDGVPMVFPAEEVGVADNLLVTVYDRGPVVVRRAKHKPRDTHAIQQAPVNDLSFAELRARVDAQWRALPKTASVYSPSLQAKMQAVASGTYQAMPVL